MPKPYRGYRLSLYGFVVESQTKRTVELRCGAVNTGRLPLDFSAKKPAPPELIVEMDTLALPETLRGHERAIEEAILAEKIDLAPSKFKTQISLRIEIGLLEGSAPAKNAQPSAEKNKPAPTAPLDKPSAKETPHGLPDLVFDTVWVVKRFKKTAKVACVIRNIGEATARLGGESLKKTEDNLAVNVYFSGTPKLSRGAILADGIFIDDRATGNGLLLPTERFYVEFEIPIEAQSKFTPQVIFELDPFQTIVEKDKTNNVRAVFSPKKKR